MCLLNLTRNTSTLVLLVFIIQGSIADENDEDAELTEEIAISDGTIQGVVVSQNGNKYYAFRGIPYAKAPIGELRFADPQKPEKWTMALETTKFGNKCVQVSLDEPGKVIGNEDCLTLNVFTPELNKDSNIPVIVWIHGGAYTVGESAVYGPDYLMSQRIILVSFNYRLNVLGFMHYDDKLLSGNYGMKDQVAVLKWVQENISAFGGNAEQVTLAGNSSGASSVHWHMYSPMSEGLFHRAICQSGTARAIWAEIPRDVAKERARAIAAMAGCMFKSPEENIKCLREKPAESLVHIQRSFQVWKRNPYYYGVVVESTDAPNSFVTVSPWTSDPIIENIPLMIGFVSEEGGSLIQDLLDDQGNAVIEFGNRYKELFPIIMLYQFNVGLKTEEAVLETTEKIQQYYFGDKEINIDTFPQIIQMAGDCFIVYDTIETLLKYVPKAYFYIFSHRNKNSFGQKAETFTDKIGPVHGDELISLFRLLYFPENLEGDDLIVSQLMVKLWSNFIINGNPNDNNNDQQWKQVSESLEFYDINVNPEMKTGDWKSHYEFWKSLRWH